MNEEKEKLVEFTFTLMEELGASSLVQAINREDWLGYPIAGIRQAADDMVEASQDIKADELEKLDKILIEKNLPTLSKMRDKNYKKLLQILSRNEIKSETEWRLLRSFVDSEILNEHESNQTKVMIEEYERLRT